MLGAIIGDIVGSRRFARLLLMSFDPLCVEMSADIERNLIAFKKFCDLPAVL